MFLGLDGRLVLDLRLPAVYGMFAVRLADELPSGLTRPSMVMFAVRLADELPSGLTRPSMVMFAVRLADELPSGLTSRQIASVF
ncbi:MAG: hypothetical protein KatS3mg104_3028 [Phycisphaerae bacterium]|nr:MAG: hypothetical protein KatS3mg104_3028 [Phycisphaerae bacterium]